VEDFLNPPAPAPTPTPSPPPAVINKAVIPGVTAPVTGATPVTTITPTDQYTGTVAWAPADDPFAGGTTYTATITLTPKAGFTLTGVAENFFTIAGTSPPATNAVNSGVVTAVFPKTDPLIVGDSYGGGIVAYILLDTVDPGYDENKQHGLIAAAADQSYSYGIQWYNGSYVETGATDTALGTGFANTYKIIAEQGATITDYAAGLARAYNGGGYIDWFLPSKEELNKLYLNKVAIGGFADLVYWSSSEYDATIACVQYFLNGGQGTHLKFDTDRVRAVRAF